MVWGVHVGKAGSVQVVDEGGLEHLHKFGERSGLSFDGERRPDAVADRAGQFGQLSGELLRGGNDLTVAQLEGAAPALAPSVVVVVVVGPGEVCGQLADYGVEVKWGV